MIVIAEEDDLCGAETFNMFMRNLWALFNYDLQKYQRVNHRQIYAKQLCGYGRIKAKITIF